MIHSNDWEDEEQTIEFLSSACNQQTEATFRQQFQMDIKGETWCIEAMSTNEVIFRHP